MQDEASIWQVLFNIAVGILSAVGGWIMHRQAQKTDEVAKGLQEHRVEVARDYVTKDDMLEQLKEIKDAIKSVDAKLDRRGEQRH